MPGAFVVAANGALPTTRESAGIQSKKPGDVAPVRGDEAVSKLGRSKQRWKRQDTGGVSPPQASKDEQACFARLERLAFGGNDVQRSAARLVEFGSHWRCRALLVGHRLEAMAPVLAFQPLNGATTDSTVAIPENQVAAWYVSH